MKVALLCLILLSTSFNVGFSIPYVASYDNSTGPLKVVIYYGWLDVDVFSNKDWSGLDILIISPDHNLESEQALSIIRSLRSAGVKVFLYLETTCGETEYSYTLASDKEEWFSMVTNRALELLEYGNGVFLDCVGPRDMYGRPTGPEYANYIALLIERIHSEGGLTIVNNLLDLYEWWREGFHNIPLNSDYYMFEDCWTAYSGGEASYRDFNYDWEVSMFAESLGLNVIGVSHGPSGNQDMIDYAYCCSLLAGFKGFYYDDPSWNYWRDAWIPPVNWDVGIPVGGWWKDEKEYHRFYTYALITVDVKSHAGILEPVSIDVATIEDVKGSSPILVRPTLNPEADAEAVEVLSPICGGVCIDEAVKDINRSMVVLAGPLSNRVSAGLNPIADLKFTRADGRWTIEVPGFTAEKPVEFGHSDYGVVTAIKYNGRFVLLVEGCTRYGTLAAAATILEGSHDGFTQLIVYWKDENGNSKVEPEEIEIVYSV